MLPNSKRLSVLLAWAYLGAFPILAAETPVRVLILSGQNNHDWHQTTSALESILAASGRFKVEVTEHPETCDAAMFSRFDALVSNWNAFGAPAKIKDWPAATREAFLNFVRQGGGFVVVHAGGSSFNDWTDYLNIAGGWWGTNTSHGPIHPFEVKISDPDHPITQGVTSFSTTDELWNRMATPPQKRVLATAFSAKDKGGSEADEPVALVTDFGRGRGFDLQLGHDARAMASAGFRTLLLRGTEWAATGKVTLPPDVGGSPDTELETALNAAARYRLGESRAPLAVVERLVAEVSGDAERSRAMAGKLASRVSGDATLEARQFFCWQLSLVGSAAQVPMLARWLADTNLAYQARLALERIPGPESAEALHSALARTAGEARVGIIQSLAVRRSEAAVADLARLLSSGPETAGAALRALGAIGGQAAAKALQAAEPTLSAGLKPLVAEAELACARDFLGRGQTNEAAAMALRLSGPKQAPAIRQPALALYVAAAPAKALDQVLIGLGSYDVEAQAAAIQALRAAGSPELLQAAAGRMSGLTPETRVRLLGLLAERVCRGARGPAALALASSDARVRAAALAALAVIGDASTVPVLTKDLATAPEPQRRAIADCLARLPDSGVDRALAATLRGDSIPSTLSLAPAVKPYVLRALVARGDPAQALPCLSDLVAAGDPALRREAIGGLGALGEPKHCALLIPLLDNPGSDGALIESALAEICRRGGGPGPLLPALTQAAGPQKVSLLNAIAAVGGPQALDAIRGELKTADNEVVAAALRMLTEWPDAGPLDDLSAFTLVAPPGRLKVLALRGVIKLAPLAKNRSIERRVELLARLLPAAGLEERKALLGALGELPSLAALQAAVAQLKTPELGGESALTVLSLVDAIGHEHPAEAKAALATVEAEVRNPDLAAQARAAALRFGDVRNLSRGAVATNPDGLAADGEAGGPQAAIDGDPKTYWDEVDNQKLYILNVRLKEKAKVVFLRIMGWKQHLFAPRDFEVLGDGKVVCKVTGAQYRNNWLTVDFPPTECASVELRITGYYGGSPAIRELEIYGF